jgi:hypothetical protein
MTLKERCQAGEAKLEQVSTALLDPRPEILDRCETELQEVADLLTSLPADSDGRTDLLRLRRRVRLLDLQVQHSTNLCQGWIQLALSQGYTDQGRPALPPSQPQAIYEV